MINAGLVTGCFFAVTIGVVTGCCGGGICSIFCTSRMYAWAVGVGVQQTSSEEVDARTRATRAAGGGTSTSKYHKSLQQTFFGRQIKNDRSKIEEK